MASKRNVLSNMLWRFAERCGAQGVSFIVSVVLARLLAPEVYGVVALITVFTAIMQLFIDSGFKSALIQKKDADQLDFSTVFYFNVGMGIVLYLILFAFAPMIARFYEKDFMTPYIRVMGLTLVVGGVNGVQHALVSKRMIFKQFFYATLTGTLVSAVVGIWMAYQGYGVWALIAQKLVNQTIDTLFLWVRIRWRPSPQFSIERLKPMFRYGSKLLASSLLNSFTEHLSSLMIGKVHRSEELGYYNKGAHIPSLVVQNLQVAVQSVLFPVIAENQREQEQVKKILRRSVMTCAYCIFPCMVGIAACAEPLVRLLFTEAWIAMVPYLQLWCFSYAFFLLHTANLQVIQALGHSGIYLRIEIIKQVISLAVTLITVRFGVLAMLIGVSAVSAFSFYINARPNKKLVDYGCFEQLRDMAPCILLNLIMGIAVVFAGRLPLADFPLLVVQVLTGVVVYLGGSVLLRLEIFDFILRTFKEMLHK